MDEGVNPHERIDGLERRFYALDALEGRVAEVERLVKYDEAARDRHHLGHSEIDRRLSNLEARLASTPDDFGGVTSTGAPKTMTRWVIVADKNRVFSRWVGMVSRSPDVEPTFFDNAGSAHIVVKALFGTCQWVSVSRVEVIERDGRLIEARYA